MPVTERTKWQYVSQLTRAYQCTELALCSDFRLGASGVQTSHIKDDGALDNHQFAKKQEYLDIHMDTSFLLPSKNKEHR